LRVVSVFYFSFVLNVRASETKLKQICFVSVLFQFYFSFISHVRAALCKKTKVGVSGHTVEEYLQRICWNSPLIKTVPT